MANIQFQLRRGLSSLWTSVNPILSSGEMGVETDTNKIKIGNGNSGWTSLLYSAGDTASIGPYVTTFNGLTGAVTGVKSFNGSTGAVTGVNSFNGSTGDIVITSLFDIFTSGSPQALAVTTLDPSPIFPYYKNVTITNNGVRSLNGSTGTIVNVAKTDLTNTYSLIQTFLSGISSAGATFSNIVNLDSNTLYKPTLQYYNEPISSPSISGNTLSLDLSLAQVFNVSLNAGISAFIVTNVPQTASRAIGFSLFLTADGTARGISWGSAVKWPSAIPPTLTTTNNKTDILSFTTLNGGTSWFGSVAGQNY